MSDLSDVILPSGLVLIGLFLVKRYTESTGQGDFSPVSKWCFGPLCMSQYGPVTDQIPAQGGTGGPGGGTVTNNPWAGLNFDPLAMMCNWEGSWMILLPCFYKNPLSGGIANG